MRECISDISRPKANMKGKSKFMIKVENEGVNINIGDIIITQSSNKRDFFFNYVIEENHKIYLLDLKAGLYYAKYNNLDDLKEYLQKGYIKNYECRLETVLNIIKNKNFIDNLETIARLFS